MPPLDAKAVAALLAIATAVAVAVATPPDEAYAMPDDLRGIIKQESPMDEIQVLT